MIKDVILPRLVALERAFCIFCFVVYVFDFIGYWKNLKPCLGVLALSPSLKDDLRNEENLRNKDNPKDRDDPKKGETPNQKSKPTIK